MSEDGQGRLRASPVSGDGRQREEPPTADEDGQNEEPPTVDERGQREEPPTVDEGGQRGQEALAAKVGLTYKMRVPLACMRQLEIRDGRALLQYR